MPNKEQFTLIVMGINKMEWGANPSERLYVVADVYDMDTKEQVTVLVCHQDGKGRFTAPDSVVLDSDIERIYCCYPAKARTHLPDEVATKVVGKWNKRTELIITNKTINGKERSIFEIKPE